jgi:hypothetical protein
VSRRDVAGAGVVTALLVVTAAGTLAYWVGFFAAGSALHSSESEAYLAYERAFPAADAWLTLAALAAAVGLARRRAWAVLAGIATGSALVYLGLLDVLFDVEQGVYAAPSGAMAVEVVINVYCLAVGPLLMAWFWVSRDQLAA